MASIPKLKGFLLEDFKEAPAWFVKLLTPLNEYMSAITNALTGRLTLKDNLHAHREPFDFETKATAANTFPLVFKNKLMGGAKVGSVRVGQIYKYNQIKMSAAYSMEWVATADGSVEVTFTGLENSTRYIGNLEFWA